jgi:hypothetical protein
MTLEEENERLRDENERLRDALAKIDQWTQAYPLDIFPVPDIDKAHAILTAHGMTVDAISAHAMRHVLKGVGNIVRAALNGEQQ